MSEPSSKPHLVAVPEAPGASDRPESPTPSRLPWVLGAALLIAALGWLLSAQQNQELRGSLDASNAALGRARAELAAYDDHVTQAHDRASVLVGELQGVAERLGELQTLLAGRPVAGAAEVDGPEAAEAP